MTNFFSASLPDLASRLKLARSGNEYRGSCPACGYSGTFSLSAKDGRPVWWCASCQDQRAITTAIRAAMGDEWRPPPAKGASKPQGADTRSARAVAAWDGALPFPGSPAETYLAARGLPGVTNLALRFGPHARHPNVSGTFPAMLALVVSTQTGKPVAVHRTYLRPDGSGKADIEPSKASKGPIRGGAIMLDTPQPGRPLVVGEGIETSLSAGRLLGVPAWAAVAAGNIQAITPPRDVSEVMIAADPDEPGQRAAAHAAHRWKARGVRVRIITPPKGAGDFNDLIRARGAGEEQP